MAFPDNKLAFQSGGWQTGQAVTTTADGNVVVDVTGAGVGNAPAMISGFPALNTSIGFDIGAGDGEAIPYLYLTATVAGTGAGTVTFSLSAAPDNGSYSPGSYTQLYESAAFVGSAITLGSTLLVPVPPTLFDWPNGTTTIEFPPRFYKVTYTVASTFTGTFIAGLLLNPPSSLLGIQYRNNFAVV